jgi:hypothetical protein
VALPVPVHLAKALLPPPPLQVRIWEIPEGGLKRNMTVALLELHGHSRRVGLVEWHPTTNNILLSAGYDYKVCGRWGQPGQSQLGVEGRGDTGGCLGTGGEHIPQVSCPLWSPPFTHSSSLHTPEQLPCTPPFLGSTVGLEAFFLPSLSTD